MTAKLAHKTTTHPSHAGLAPLSARHADTGKAHPYILRALEKSGKCPPHGETAPPPHKDKSPKTPHAPAIVPHDHSPRHLGVHALGLSRWSSDSTQAFIQALQNSAPQTFEITFAPFWWPFDWNDADPDKLLPGSAFANAQKLLDAFKGSTHNLILTAYLSFHGGKRGATADPLKDRLSKVLVKRAQAYESNILNTYYSEANMTFNLSPSLEDNWDDATFINYASVMMASLDWTYADKLAVRRSSGTLMPPGLTVYKSQEDASSKSGCREQPHTFRLQSEVHQPHIHDKTGYYAWSNDGVFTWLDNPANGAHIEAHDSAIDSGAFTDNGKIEGRSLNYPT